jgi:hypothetical protein
VKYIDIAPLAAVPAATDADTAGVTAGVPETPDAAPAAPCAAGGPASRGPAPVSLTGAGPPSSLLPLRPGRPRPRTRAPGCRHESRSSPPAAGPTSRR